MQLTLSRGMQGVLRRVLVPASALALLTGVAVIGLGAGAANASVSKVTVCSGGTIGSGTYLGLRVTGHCTVPAGADITIRGDLVVNGRRANLNAWMFPSHFTVLGDAYARNGAVLGIGSPVQGPSGCPSDASATVTGNIFADHARTMYLDCTTVWGHLRSLGGGKAGQGPNCEQNHARALNFVVKDNVIYGTTALVGWQGCWLGYVRNLSYATVSVNANVTTSFDSTEIVTNTIYGDLRCRNNQPAPQIGDSGGSPNTVSGQKLGQCHHL